MADSDPIPAARRRPVRDRTVGRLTLTPRDREVLCDLRRHGACSVLLVAELRFGGSVPAARERLRRLARAVYVRRLPTVVGQYGGYRLADRGLAEVAPGRRAARPRAGTGPAWMLHAMLVAEVAEWHLRRQHRAGWAVRWRTEQELRDGVPWLPLPHARGRFRLPDGVLELVSPDGEVKRCAVEVERRGKRPHRYPPKLRWYATRLAERTFRQVRWFVAHDAAAVVRRQVEASGLGDAVRVLPLPDGLRTYG